MTLLFNIIKSTQIRIRHYSVELKKFMQYLDNPKLLHCSGNIVDAAKAFKNKKIICYYFSASWCQPCKQLLPKIKNIYQLNRKMKAGLEIIYISSDEDKTIMEEYFFTRHGEWYAIPFEDDGAEVLRQMYNVAHIPQIIVVKEDGQMISRTGTKDINELGTDVLVAWNTSPVV